MKKESENRTEDVLTPSDYERIRLMNRQMVIRKVRNTLIVLAILAAVWYCVLLVKGQKVNQESIEKSWENIKEGVQNVQRDIQETDIPEKVRNLIPESPADDNGKGDAE